MSNEQLPFSPAHAFMLAIGEARVGGAEAERERIIALLEEQIETAEANGLDCPRWAIALIKGDNK